MSILTFKTNKFLYPCDLKPPPSSSSAYNNKFKHTYLGHNDLYLYD